LSDELKHLISMMLCKEPSQRPSIADIKSHAWYNKTVAPDSIDLDVPQDDEVR
jgi:serine/threonine protein kinase